jgi:hypothetical protein
MPFFAASAVLKDIKMPKGLEKSPRSMQNGRVI